MDRIIVIGSITIDEQIRNGNASILQIGGVGTYGAITYKREGLDAITVCNLGGQFQHIAKDTLTKMGVGLSTGVTDELTYFINTVLSTGERYQELRNLSHPISESLVKNLIKDSSHIHLGPIHQNDISQSIITRLNKRSLLVTLDVQGYLRSYKLGKIKSTVAPELDHALNVSKIIKGDHLEIAMIVNHYGINIKQLLRKFNVDEAIVTSAEKGGYVMTISGKRINYDAAHIEKLVDSTGAGDVFFSAYIVGRIYRGLSISKACQLAAQKAAMQVEGKYIIPMDLEIKKSK